jgi:hypothetical protein
VNDAEELVLRKKPRGQDMSHYLGSSRRRWSALRLAAGPTAERACYDR